MHTPLGESDRCLDRKKEATIILIAFVVVAVVFSYVMLGAGFFATRKSQEVTYSGIKQSISNIVPDGQLYGDASNIAMLPFYLSIPERGQPQKPAEVDYLYILKNGTVTVVSGADADSVGLLQPGDRAKITDAL